MPGVNKSRGRCGGGKFFFTVAPNVCKSSVWNLLRATLLAPNILRWLLDFWKNLLTPFLCKLKHEPPLTNNVVSVTCGSCFRTPFQSRPPQRPVLKHANMHYLCECLHSGTVKRPTATPYSFETKSERKDS